MKLQNRLLILLLLGTALSAQQIQAPPVHFAGPVGPGGPFPLFNSGTITLQSDADYTLVGADTTASVIRITTAAGLSLSATRNIIAPQAGPPFFGYEYTIQNATAGGQSIVVKGQTGNGVTIPNGQTMLVVYDGTNYVAASGSSADAGHPNPQKALSLTGPQCNAKCDSVTDDTVAIRACIQRATATSPPTPIYIPPATQSYQGCVITDTIAFPANGQTIFGDNPIASTFIWRGNDSTKPALEISGANVVAYNFGVLADVSGCGTSTAPQSTPCGNHAWKTGISYGGPSIPGVFTGRNATESSFRNVFVSCGGYYGSQTGDAIQIGANVGQADQVTFDRDSIYFCRYGSGLISFSPNAVELFVNGSTIYMNHIGISTGTTSDWKVSSAEIDNNEIMVYGNGGGGSSFEGIRAESTKRYFYSPGGNWYRPIIWSGNTFTNFTDTRDPVTATVTSAVAPPFFYVSVPPPAAASFVTRGFIEGDDVIIYDSTANVGTHYIVQAWQNPDGTPSTGTSLQMCCWSGIAPSFTNAPMTSYINGCSFATTAGSANVTLIGPPCLRSNEYYNVANAGPLPTVRIVSATGTGGAVSVTTMDGGVSTCSVTAPGSGYPTTVDAIVDSGSLGRGAVLRVGVDQTTHVLSGCKVLASGNSYGDWPAGAFVYDSATTGHFATAATQAVGITIHDGVQLARGQYLMAPTAEISQFQNWVGYPVIVHGAGDPANPAGTDLVTYILRYIPSQPAGDPSPTYCQMPDLSQQFPCLLLGAKTFATTDRTGITVDVGYTRAYYWYNHWGQFAFLGGAGPHTFIANSLGNANAGHFAAQCNGDNGCAFIGNAFSDLAPNPGWITNSPMLTNQFATTKNFIGGNSDISMLDVFPFTRASIVPEQSGNIALQGAAAKRFIMSCTSACNLLNVQGLAAGDTVDVIIKGVNTTIVNNCAPGTICTGTGADIPVTTPGLFQFRMGDDYVVRMMNGGGGGGGSWSVINNINTSAIPANIQDHVSVGDPTPLSILNGVSGAVGGTCGANTLASTSGQWAIACNASNEVIIPNTINVGGVKVNGTLLTGGNVSSIAQNLPMSTTTGATVFTQTMDTPTSDSTYYLTWQLQQLDTGSGGACNAGTLGVVLGFTEAVSNAPITAQLSGRAFNAPGGTNGFSAGTVIDATNYFVGFPFEFTAKANVPVTFTLTQLTASNCTNAQNFTLRAHLKAW